VREHVRDSSATNYGHGLNAVDGLLRVDSEPGCVGGPEAGAAPATSRIGEADDWSVLL
jgi:hypothetical protein